MQVRCVRPFGRHAVGDLAEVPDDAAVDPDHWEPAETAQEKKTGAPVLPDLPEIPREGM
jgi:hypothetical protein